MKMIAKKLSEVRKHMKDCCDEVYKGADLFVTRKNNENVVIISESRYNELIGRTPDTASARDVIKSPVCDPALSENTAKPGENAVRSGKSKK